MGQFKYMPKMESTEESVVLKLKKGGKVKMMDGGVPPAAVAANRQMGALPPMQRRAAPPPVAMARRPAVPGALMRKKGGEVESKSVHAKEEREMAALKKELKSHENKPASKGHKGLKTGGVITKNEGSKTGSVEQFRGGYKKGGKACMAEGGVPAGVGMSLTPATREMAEKVRPSSPAPAPRDMSRPSAADMEAMRRQLAEQKQDMQNEAGYNRTYGKKTGGVMKKFASGGCVEGFKANKKGGTW